MQEELHHLLENLLNGELNETGRQQLLVYLETQSGADLFAALLDQQLTAKAFALSSDLPETEQQFISNVLQKAGIPAGNHAADQPDPKPVVHRVHFMRRWGWAAASALLLFAAGAYFYMAGTKSNPPVVSTENIAPGKEGAILTLADGSQVILDSMSNGVIADQNGSKAVLHNGQLSYNAQEKNTGAILYNTMSTPRGRQFRVTLPDGTGVWLNAASSIKYPTVFSGNIRQVYITGEVYFEVAKNEKMPFRVNANNRETVDVLGTEFNVSAYDNDATINTTLVSGVVRVASTILKPGQQAQMTNTNSPRKLNVINDADLDKILAWKKGIFNFDDVSLQEVMKQLERWYNIEVVYEKGIPDIKFGGKMSKDMALNGLLIALEKSEVKFRLEGNKLIVTK